MIEHKAEINTLAVVAVAIVIAAGMFWYGSKTQQIALDPDICADHVTQTLYECE